MYKHWTKTRAVKKEWTDTIGWLAKSKKPRIPFDKAHIHFHISVGDNRAHDPDNLAWSVTKPALDAIKGHIIVDDSIDHVTLSYTYDRLIPRGFSMEIKETP